MTPKVLGTLTAAIFGCSTLTSHAAAQELRLSNSVPRLSALAKLPVREITVFKDGHAFVLHEGTMPVDVAGNVLLDHLPTPILGTFWPYSANPQVPLQAVTSSPRRTLIDRTALTLRDLLEANIGAPVTVTEQPENTQTLVKSYDATILAMPARSTSELEITNPSTNPLELLPQKGNLIWLKTEAGTKVLSVEQIRHVTFRNSPQAMLGNEEFRNLLTLKLNWGNRPLTPTAPVGMMYLQKGFRWIPNYRLSLDQVSTGTQSGTARLQLQATLLNELTDLQNVNANLVIGVPSFAFKDTTDPIALNNVLAQLSPYFDGNTRGGFALSNAITTQAARMSEYRAPVPTAATRDLGPEIGGTEKNEDLFLFSVKNVSLKRGERMTLPVVEYQTPYKDIYTLDLPFAPPPDIYRNINTQQQAELATLLSAPKVVHRIRLTNKSNQPYTTAPVLIMKNERVLSQGMMTYTAPGANSDLTLTTAIDVQVNKSDVESGRIPDAAKWQGDSYGRVNLNGKISLCNYSKETIELELTRYVLGSADSVNNGGKIEKINSLESNQIAAGMYPSWWNNSNWYGWWNQMNGLSRITWRVRLEPRKDVDLGYTWHYFWR